MKDANTVEMNELYERVKEGLLDSWTHYGTDERGEDEEAGRAAGSSSALRATIQDDGSSEKGVVQEIEETTERHVERWKTRAANVLNNEVRSPLKASVEQIHTRLQNLGADPDALGEPEEVRQQKRIVEKLASDKEDLVDERKKLGSSITNALARVSISGRGYAEVNWKLRVGYWIVLPLLVLAEAFLNGVGIEQMGVSPLAGLIIAGLFGLGLLTATHIVGAHLKQRKYYSEDEKKFWIWTARTAIIGAVIIVTLFVILRHNYLVALQSQSVDIGALVEQIQGGNAVETVQDEEAVSYGLYDFLFILANAAILAFGVLLSWLEHPKHLGLAKMHRKRKKAEKQIAKINTKQQKSEDVLGKMLKDNQNEVMDLTRKLTRCQEILDECVDQAAGVLVERFHVYVQTYESAGGRPVPGDVWAKYSSQSVAEDLRNRVRPLTDSGLDSN